VTLYQTIGGDTLLQATPVCQPLPGDKAATPTAAQCTVG
jgi:hypothetical protein